MRIRALAILGCVCLTGCTTTLYKPNQVSAPLLREAHEFKATIAPNNLQLAYAPIDHLGILANGYYESYDQDARHGFGWLGEAGAGYYGELIHNLVWEAYGGAGYGQVALSDVLDPTTTPRPVHYDADAFRVFAQPNLGYVSPYFEVSGSVRFSGVKYLGLHVTGYSAAEQSSQGLVATDITGPMWFFAEPSVTVKAGYKWAKVFYQRTWSLKLNDAPLAADGNAQAIGLQIDIAQWFNDFTW